MAKHIVLFANTTTVAGETINEPTANLQTGSPAWTPDKSAFNKMNVILDVKTLTGTSPTMTFSIQESFGGIFAETAKSTAISATGKYILCQHALPATAAANNQGAFPALGMGMDKRVVTTAGGTVGTLNADIYLDFFSER